MIITPNHVLIKIYFLEGKTPLCTVKVNRVYPGVWDSHSPVSYTHLDVYKRQLLSVSTYTYAYQMFNFDRIFKYFLLPCHKIIRHFQAF